ncbi:MAG: hypothetical protein ACHQX3_03200 [Nitrospirales bacterium]
MTKFFLVALIVASLAHAKDKKKQVLPDYVLKAETVLVVIRPDAGEPVSNPTANRTAQESVEKALMKWGRFRLVMDAQTADLVIAVRKGHAGGPTITNSPTDDRPVIVQPSGGDIRVGGQEGRPPDLTNPGRGGSADRGPRMGNEIGSSEDTFELYRGGVEYPLDAPPVWRYTAKDALKGPQVTAVEQFQKVLSESEKQQQKKP